MDIFAETLTYRSSSKTVIVQTIVGLQFNESGDVTDRSGYRRTTAFTESGQTVDYSQAYISPGLAAFVQNIEGLGRPQTVFEKYLDAFFVPNSQPDNFNRFINAGPLNGN